MTPILLWDVMGTLVHDPFFIETPHGRAEALGTVFSVTVK